MGGAHPRTGLVVPVDGYTVSTDSIPRDTTNPGPVIHPGEILLEEFLKPLGMTQAPAAKALGMSTVRLNELVRGKRGVTADTALRLAKFFKTTPQLCTGTASTASHTAEPSTS